MVNYVFEFSLIISMIIYCCTKNNIITKIVLNTGQYSAYQSFAELEFLSANF